MGLLRILANITLDYRISSTKKKEEQMITKHNEDGSISFIYESWDELLNQEPTWQPDPDLYAKDKEDERMRSMFFEMKRKYFNKN